ncbi:MAG: ankyrin repeat domain-containing protein, partial [Betaproteobacteria bacterium]
MTMLRKYFRWAVYLVLALGFSLARAGSYEDFFEAVARNDGPAINALLQRGFDVNSRDPKGQTGLFLALRAGAFNAAEALSNGAGLDVNALNEVGESALMMAALKGHVD